MCERPDAGCAVYQQWGVRGRNLQPGDARLPEGIAQRRRGHQRPRRAALAGERQRREPALRRQRRGAVADLGGRAGVGSGRGRRSERRHEPERRRSPLSSVSPTRPVTTCGDWLNTGQPADTLARVGRRSARSSRPRPRRRTIANGLNGDNDTTDRVLQVYALGRHRPTPRRWRPARPSARRRARPASVRQRRTSSSASASPPPATARTCSSSPSAPTSGAGRPRPQQRWRSGDLPMTTCCRSTTPCPAS